MTQSTPSSLQSRLPIASGLVLPSFFFSPGWRRDLIDQLCFPPSVVQGRSGPDLSPSFSIESLGQCNLDSRWPKTFVSLIPFNLRDFPPPPFLLDKRPLTRWEKDSPNYKLFFGPFSVPTSGTVRLPTPLDSSCQRARIFVSPGTRTTRNAPFFVFYNYIFAVRSIMGFFPPPPLSANKRPGTA